MPQTVKGGSLPVIASSTVVPVYFSGDPLQAALDAKLRAWPSSAVFQALGEYGITSASIGSSIVVSETPAAMLTAQEVQTWVEGKLDGTHPEFGPVDATTLASKVFVIYYPAATTISYGASLCQGEVNAGLTLSSGAVANWVAVAECGTPPPGLSESDSIAGSAEFGVACQIVSPDPQLQVYPSNWQSFDTAHAASGLLLTFAPQVVAGCILARATPAGTGFNAVPVSLDAGVPRDAERFAVWSNKAAAAYHDPCLPNVGGPYFVSVPVARDPVQVTLQMFATPMVVTSTGVLVPVGSTKTVDMQLLSDGPTSGPWTVSADVLDGSGFTFAFDRTTGQNGDVLHLSITAPSTAQQGTAVVYSTLDGRRTFSMFLVQSQ
jgi:hypothetical protein